jgi:FtsH-binding integral membrane protein
VWICLILALGILIVIACFPKMHKYPFDYMLLFGFTGFFSVFAASVTARYDVVAIGIALAVTCAAVLGAFCVAAFTKLDLTRAGGFLMAILFAVIVMSILAIVWRNKCDPAAALLPC